MSFCPYKIPLSNQASSNILPGPVFEGAGQSTNSLSVDTAKECITGNVTLTGFAAMNLRISPTKSEVE